MTKTSVRYRYLLYIFIYALRAYNEVYLYTLFRCVFIFRVLTDFLELKSDDIGDSDNGSNLHINDDLSVADQSILDEAMVHLVNEGFVIRDGSKVVINSQLIEEFIDNRRHSEKFVNDLNRIGNFVNIVFSYPDDIILSMYLKDPNIEYAKKRNIGVVNLDKNKLQLLLEKFKLKAKDEYNKDLDNYDVFVSWMNFVQSEYIKGKNTNE